jgi:hypothetical protein
MSRAVDSPPDGIADYAVDYAVGADYNRILFFINGTVIRRIIAKCRYTTSPQL